MVGGDRTRMLATLAGEVRWLPGSTMLEAVRSLRRVGKQEICHAHMTIAEALAVATRRVHGSPVVSTRHFAARRGTSRAGRLFAPHIARRLARQVAVSSFVARHLERSPDAVIPNGVPASPCVWRASSRGILVLQRLEREKDTITALRAWQASCLVDEGWALRVVGGGSEGAGLRSWAASERVAGVTFSGPTQHVDQEFAKAAVLLAPAPAEPFGLTVVEAMAAGVPVVASSSGGHLETVGLLPGAVTFPAGDATAAATALRSMLFDTARSKASHDGRQLVEQHFTIGRHVDQLLDEYAKAHSSAVEPVLHRPAPES